MPERHPLPTTAYTEKAVTTPRRTAEETAEASAVYGRRAVLQGLLISALSGNLSVAQEIEKAEDQIAPMERLERLHKMNSGSFSTMEVGAAAVPDMERYRKVLENTERKIPLAEAKKAADLLISRLYYGNDAWNRVRAVLGEHRKVPYLTIESEAALLQRLQNVEGEEKDRNDLRTRLITDILWYDCYRDDESVLHFAVEKLCDAVLSPKGPVDCKAYLALLHHVQPSSTIGAKAVHKSYPRLVQWIRTRMLELKKPHKDRKECAHEKLKFLSQLGELEQKLSLFFREQTAPADELVKFTAWRQEYLLHPAQEIVKEMMKEELGPSHRTAMGAVIAQQLMANNAADLHAAKACIARWGYDRDAHLAFPKHTDEQSSPYNFKNPAATLFVDMYRASRGDDGPAKRYVDPADRKNPQALDRVLINDSGVYLATFEALSKHSPAPPRHIMQQLERNVYATLRTHVSQIGAVPSLAEWGEMSARFLNIGESPNFEDPAFHVRIKEMKALLVDGFNISSGNQWEPVASVFATHTSKVTLALMREKKAERQREIEKPAAEKIAQDRAAFIRAFRAAAPKLPKQDKILQMLGFSEEECTEAKKSSHRVSDSSETMFAAQERIATVARFKGV